MKDANVFWSEARKRYMLKYKTDQGWKPKSLPKELATQKQAEAWAANWLAGERARRGAARPSVLGFSIADKQEAWLALRAGRNLRKATRTDDAGNLTHHIVPSALGRIPMAQIEPLAVREFVRELKKKVGFRRKETLSGLRIRNILNTLELFLDDAIAEKWAGSLEKNPARDPSVDVERPPAERRSGKKVLHLEAAQLQAVLDHPGVPEARKIRYLFDAHGLREGETSALRFDRIFLEAEVPYADVSTAIAMQGEDGYATESPTKSEASERQVPLSPALVAALRWWWERGWALTYGRSAPKPGDVLFPGKVREHARPKASSHLRKDLATAGQPTQQRGFNLTAHHLRHSCSTWLNEADVAESDVGMLLGHEGQSVTRRHYTAATLKKLGGMVAKIPLTWMAPERRGVGAPGGHGSGRGSDPTRNLKAPPLDHLSPLLAMAMNVVQAGDGGEMEPSPTRSGSFVNRRSPVQSRKVAPVILRG